MLLREIETFLRKTGMKVTTFGRRAANDPRLVHDLRKGRIPRKETEARIKAFINTYEQEPAQ